MTATIVIPDITHPVWAQIKTAILDGDPTVLTYDSYEGSRKRGIFTFRESAIIPDRLQRFRILMHETSRFDLQDIEFLDYLCSICRATDDKTSPEGNNCYEIGCDNTIFCDHLCTVAGEQAAKV